MAREHWLSDPPLGIAGNGPVGRRWCWSTASYRAGTCPTCPAWETAPAHLSRSASQSWPRCSPPRSPSWDSAGPWSSATPLASRWRSSSPSAGLPRSGARAGGRHRRPRGDQRARPVGTLARHRAAGARGAKSRLGPPGTHPHQRRWNPCRMWRVGGKTRHPGCSTSGIWRPRCRWQWNGTTQPDNSRRSPAEVWSGSCLGRSRECGQDHFSGR